MNAQHAQTKPRYLRFMIGLMAILDRIYTRLMLGVKSLLDWIKNLIKEQPATPADSECFDLPLNRATIKKYVEAWLKYEPSLSSKWYTRAKVKEAHAYEAYFETQLRLRFIEAADWFRASIGNHYTEKTFDFYAAWSIAKLLHQIERALNTSKPDLPAISSQLAEVNRYMIWLYPPDILAPILKSACSDLENLNIPGKQPYLEELKAWTGEMPKTKEELHKYHEWRMMLDKVLQVTNAELHNRQIGVLLQIRRLRRLSRCGLTVLACSLLLSPLATNLEGLMHPATASLAQGDMWPVQWIVFSEPLLRLVSSELVLGWANAAAIVLMGMAGGFVSGFLQARRTLIQPPEYEIDKLKFWLKPLAGGLLALILYALLSWQIVPGIDIKNNGSYFLMALLSGFSERYFLKVLELDGTSEHAAEPTNPRQFK